MGQHGAFEGTSCADRLRLTDKVVLTAASFLPLLLNWRQFRILFWFHDDWDLLDTLDREGVVRWIFRPFAESLAPLFKLVWYAALRVAGGDYAVMVCSLWICHCANVLLFATLLRRIGLSRSGALISALTLAVSWTNIETLGWSPQLSQLLCLSFLLLGAHSMLDFIESGRHLILSACFAFASALCFARGILAGILLIFWFALARRPRAASRELWSAAAALLAPAAAVVAAHYLAVVQLSARSIADFLAMAKFAASCLLLNPLYMLIAYPGRTLGPAALLILGGAKISILVFALVKSDRARRNLLQTLLAFDLCNSALLGIGRYGTGWAAAASSRYQYVSLLCFAPFLVTAAGCVSRKLARGRLGATCLTAVFWISILVVPWPRKVDQWVQWRGYDVRAQLAETAPRHGLGLSDLPGGRIQQLVRTFHLH